MYVHRVAWRWRRVCDDIAEQSRTVKMASCCMELKRKGSFFILACSSPSGRNICGVPNSLFPVLAWLVFLPQMSQPEVAFQMCLNPKLLQTTGWRSGGR